MNHDRRALQSDHSLACEPPVGVVRNLPWIAVRVGEVAGVAAPEHRSCFREQSTASRDGGGKRSVNLRRLPTFCERVTLPNPPPCGTNRERHDEFRVPDNTLAGKSTGASSACWRLGILGPLGSHLHVTQPATWAFGAGADFARLSSSGLPVVDRSPIDQARRRPGRRMVRDEGAARPRADVISLAGAAKPLTNGWASEASHRRQHKSR